MKKTIFLSCLLATTVALAGSEENPYEETESSPLMMIPRAPEKESPRQRAATRIAEQERRERSNVPAEDYREETTVEPAPRIRFGRQLPTMEDLEEDMDQLIALKGLLKRNTKLGEEVRDMASAYKVNLERINSLIITEKKDYQATLASTYNSKPLAESHGNPHDNSLNALIKGFHSRVFQTSQTLAEREAAIAQERALLEALKIELQEQREALQQRENNLQQRELELVERENNLQQREQAEAVVRTSEEVMDENFLLIERIEKTLDTAQALFEAA